MDAMIDNQNVCNLKKRRLVKGRALGTPTTEAPVERRAHPKLSIGPGDKVIEVPFHERHEAKRLGAKWNDILKKWTVPSKHEQSEAFEEWTLVGASTERELTFSSGFAERHLRDVFGVP